jgi:mono/diheme cytochrome c family protein
MICLLASAAVTTGAQPKGAKPTPPDPKLVSMGHTLFLSNCSPCHGAQAEGDDGPNLHHIGLTDAFIASTVTNGIKDQMPPFGQKLKAQDLKAVVAFVHSLQ